MNIKPTGASESSYRFLYQYLDLPEDIELDHIPSRLVKSLKPFKILWAHSNCDQPMYLGIDWNKITHIVAVSSWEKQQFITRAGVSENKITVIRNGGADYFVSKNKKSKILIYTSNPFKGLIHLPVIWKRILERHPDAKLKIFSSMDLYEQEDDEYVPTYEQLRSIPNVEISKVIPHRSLVKHYQESLVFCYPNIWEETSCVSLIEAMRSGCYPVITDIGALPETAAGFGTIVPMTGISTNRGWIPDAKFLTAFSDTVISILDQYTYDPSIAEFSSSHYDWKSIANEWKILIDKIKQGKVFMKNQLSKLSNTPSGEILNDPDVLEKVFDEIFKWESFDKEHAQGRSNFQIEKFIALDNFTVASSFNALLKNRRILAEGLFGKITEMQEKNREFEYKWKEHDTKEPIEWFTADGGKKLCWHDLDKMNLENYLRTSELEIRDRVQQMEFFDQLLEKLIEVNGGPITREQFEKEDHIYWERRFANQAYDEMLSRRTGISIGNLHSMRRASAPTIVSNDMNRVKNDFPDLKKAIDGGEKQTEFMLDLQKKVMEGITEVTGIESLAIANENIAERLNNLETKFQVINPNRGSQQKNISPKNLFNSEYNRKN